MMSERRIVRETTQYFHSLKYDTKTEIPLLENRMDIVAYNRDFSRLIAVETKVDKWFRALQQAVLYRICANKVYVAISEDYVHRVDQPMLKQLGIGLLSVNGYVEEVIEPNPTKYIIHNSVRKTVIDSLLKASRWSYTEQT